MEIKSKKHGKTKWVNIIVETTANRLFIDSNEMDFMKQGCRILMMMTRKKDSEEKKEPIIGISNSIETFNKQLLYLRAMKYPNARIYSSVNERHILKAIRLFKQRQLDVDYESLNAKHDFYLNIQKRFISCLQNPQSKKESNFLIDIDHKDETYLALTVDVLKAKTKVLLLKPTPNGWHVVVEPFDCSDFALNHQHITVKKDDMLFLE